MYNFYNLAKFFKLVKCSLINAFSSLLMFSVNTTVTRMSCRRNGRFQRRPGKRFTGQPNELRRAVRTVEMCSTMCLAASDVCELVNYNAKDEVCEFFDKITTGNLTDATGWEHLTTITAFDSHFRLGSICERNRPCEIHEICSVTCGNPQGYLCNGYNPFVTFTQYLFGMQENGRSELQCVVSESKLETAGSARSVYYGTQYNCKLNGSDFQYFFQSQGVTGQARWKFTRVVDNKLQTQKSGEYGYSRPGACYMYKTRTFILYFGNKIYTYEVKALNENPKMVSDSPDYKPTADIMLVYYLPSGEARMFIHNWAAKHWRTVQLTMSGSLGNSVYSTFDQAYDVLLTVTFREAVYLFGHSATTLRYFIREILSNNYLAVYETTNGTSTVMYHKQFAYEVDGRHYLMGWNKDTHETFARQFYSNGTLEEHAVIWETNPTPKAFSTKIKN